MPLEALWPEARSVVMLAEVYTPAEDPLAVLGRRDRGAVSVYARGRDYHDLVKPRLKRLGRWLVAETGAAIKVFVDTAPVMEKPLAQAAGIGWQGKHTNLLSRELGNWFFLGAIFTELELPRDRPGEDHCGSCRACLDACPTGALPAPYRLDARRCISYLTIEHDGPVEEGLRPLIGIFMPFALVVALVVILYFFASTLVRLESRGPTIVIPTREAAEAYREPGADTLRRDAGGRTFEHTAGGWRQLDLPASPTPRDVPLGTPEAAALLAAHPWLGELVSDGDAVTFLLDAEVLHLQPGKEGRGERLPPGGL